MASPSRTEALATLERGQEELDILFEQLSQAELAQPNTIGGGDWAAKDLMGHIAFWEELALDTLDAWRARRRPRVEDIFSQHSTDQVNAENQAQTAPQSPAEIRARAASAHQALISAIHSVSDAEWNAAPPYENAAEPTLADLLGGVLGAPNHPFGHAYAHLDDLRAFVNTRS